ncbi:MAG: hypothetical protein WD533_06550 [Dehalococcoidia bacterium]
MTSHAYQRPPSDGERYAFRRPQLPMTRQDGRPLLDIWLGTERIGRVWAWPDEASAWPRARELRDFAVWVVAEVNAGHIVLADRSLQARIDGIEDVLREVGA